MPSSDSRFDFLAKAVRVVSCEHLLLIPGAVDLPVKTKIDHILSSSAAMLLLVLCSPFANAQLAEVSIDEASSLCSAMRSQYVREFAGDEPEYRPSTQPGPDDRFKFHDLAGVSIPIVSEHEGWRFAFHLNYTILVNEKHGVEYMIRRSIAGAAGEVFVRMQEHRNLPPPGIEGIDLLKAALAADPEGIDCDSGSASALLDKFWTMGTKALAFRDAEAIFSHRGSLLTRRQFERSSERWLFLAEDPQTGKYRDIAITVYDPERFPQIGLRIGGTGGTVERKTPSWLDQFLLTAARPSRASFAALVTAVGDYPLPASVMQLVDETLYAELPD